MLFSDPIFLFVFLPLALFFFYIAPEKLKNIVLLLASLFFYAWGEKFLVVLLIISSLVDYIAGILIAKNYRKFGLYFSIAFNLSLLIYFKYANFLVDNVNNVIESFGSSTHLTSIYVIMPLGISFFTFQTMSYTIDVYRGKVKATYNFIDFCTYVSLFPQLVAGPIVRYEEIKNQLKNKSLTISKFATGAERFVIGLFKKIFIANNLALVADIAFENNIGYGTLFSWLGIITYTLYIYYDFSGYSDMAIGLGKMFGFDFPENFNYPYIAKSIRDFWRRWHMSMSNWFKDYVYVSLGGNRKSKNRVLLNLLIVFIVTGLWHGAAWNFVVWGLWHGLFLVLERKGWIKTTKKWSHIYVILVVALGFVFFRASDLGHAINYIKQLFWYEPIYDVDVFKYTLRGETILAYFLALVFMFPISRYFEKYISEKGVDNNMYWGIKAPVFVIMMLICYTYISIGAYNPFIYFRF